MLGVIYDYSYHDKAPLTFQSKSEAFYGGKPITMNAILCKSCGHTELVADLSEFMPSKRRVCPYCKAIYSYKEQDEVLLGIVKCYNCSKEFAIEPDNEA
jgi:hypothetical protein